MYMHKHAHTYTNAHTHRNRVFGTAEHQVVCLCVVVEGSVYGLKVEFRI